jgi:hypothetical protein
VPGSPVDGIEMARRFGASVDIAKADDSGLFLIVGAGVSPTGAITAIGGQIIVRLPGTVKVLAVLSAAAQSAAQRHPDIALVGPVMIDPARFAAFAALTGLDAEPPAEHGSA